MIAAVFIRIKVNAAPNIGIMRTLRPLINFNVIAAAFIQFKVNAAAFIKINENAAAFIKINENTSAIN